MSPRALLVAYFAAGAASALLVLTRSQARGPSCFASAAAAVVLWPLWLPFALGPGGSSLPERVHRDVERRIRRAVERARSAVVATELDVMLPASDADAILHEVDRIAARLDAVEAELAGVRADARHSEHATRRAERLRELATRDSRALDEVSDLTELLATELVLARHGRSDGVEPLLAELAARIEALRAS